MQTTVKMARRKAELLLNNNDCVVVLKDGVIHFTEEGIRQGGGVFVKDLKKDVKIESIDKIEYTDRYGNVFMLKIAW